MPLPYWSARSSIRSLPTLARDLHVDVVVLGGGVTGLTTALLLLMSGHRVAVLERDRCAGGDTGHTSAHLTMVTDERLSDLSKSLGATHAQAVWDAGLAGINQIDVLASTHRIDCGFEWVPGFLYARPGTNTDAALDLLREEADAATDLGFDAELVPSVPLMQTPGVRYDNQARLRPRKYVGGLVDAIIRLGGHVFERSAPEHFVAAPLRMKVNGHTVTCDELVVATHNPTMGVASVASAAMLQSTLALYTSYVIAATVAKGRAPDALLWDTETPYRYFRVDPQPDHDVVIFGGEDHKTGQTDDPDACYARLEHALQTLLPGADVTHRWSGQIIHTPDGLPFIGRVADHQFMATGFNGNGLTFGTVGAMIISDAIAGQTNPWAELFAPGRGAIRRGVWDYVKENADYAYYMVRDRFAGASSRSLRAVRRGEGRIIEQHGKKVAAYRDARGVITLRSPVCTHLGCLVVWNTAESTWDCPCHGSRFKPNGDVIAGPAESPLAAITE